MCSCVCVLGFPVVTNHHRVKWRQDTQMCSLSFKANCLNPEWKWPPSLRSSRAETGPRLFQLPCPVALFPLPVSELTLSSLLFLTAISHTEISATGIIEIQSNFLMTRSHLWRHFLNKVICEGSKTGRWQPALRQLYRVVSMCRVCFFVSSVYSTELLTWAPAQSLQKEQTSKHGGSLLRVTKSTGKADKWA